MHTCLYSLAGHTNFSRAEVGGVMGGGKHPKSSLFNCSGERNPGIPAAIIMHGGSYHGSSCIFMISMYVCSVMVVATRVVVTHVMDSS